MAATKDLFIDLGGAGASVDSQPRLVRGILDSSTYTLPMPYHGDRLNLAIRALARNPDSIQTAPYSYLDLSGCTLAFRIWDSTGTTILAAQTTWGIGANNNILTAQVDLFTSAMQAAIASLGPKDTLSTILEITLTFSDGVYTYRNNDFRIGKSLNTSGTGSTIPSGRVLTYDEAVGMFVQFFGNTSGRTITLASPDGTHTRVIGVANDGSAIDSTT